MVISALLVANLAAGASLAGMIDGGLVMAILGHVKWATRFEAFDLL